MANGNPIPKVLELLDLHYESFYAVEPFATEWGHQVPTHTTGWSQIIVSALTGIKGLDRKKGTDLADNSDVKGANTWKAIDTPRFNGVIKAGTKAETAGKMESLDEMPHIFLVLWDTTIRETHRCRIWVVRPQRDRFFREMCALWYAKRDQGEITSSNFQLHPPRGLDTNAIRNECGNLIYPLYFCADRVPGKKYVLVSFDPQVLESGECTKAP